MADITEKLNKAIKKFTSAFKEVNEDCTEEQVREALQELKPENKEYINPYDYCTVQTAMDILGLRYNRNQFYKITKKYGLKVYRNPVNRHPLGYKIQEIEKVLVELKKNT